MARKSKPASPQAEAKKLPDSAQGRSATQRVTVVAPAARQQSLLSNLINLETVRAFQLFLLAAISSALSQLNLAPVYGSIPSDLYHRYGTVICLFLAYGLSGRQLPWLYNSVPAFCFWIPTFQFALFHFSSTFGPQYGPLVTELLTCYPLLVASMYIAFRLLQNANRKSASQSAMSEAGFAGGVCILFSLLRRNAQIWLSRYMGSNILFSRVNMQLLIGVLYGMVLPQSLFWPAVPAVLLTFTANPHNSLMRTTNVLNNTLSLYDYTLVDRRESMTGYISVLDSNKDHFRVLRCDHSLLGGEWLLPPRDPAKGPPRLVAEPIYAVFTMLESVRLVQPAPATPASDQTALVIGLGTGTAPSALIMHGINTTILELDPVIHEFAVRYFNLPTNHSYMITNAAGVVEASDPAREASSYDYIVHDVFTGGAEPAELFTVEFLQGLRMLLKDDGVIAINYAGDLAMPSTSLVYRTVTQVFGTCRVFREEPPPGPNSAKPKTGPMRDSGVKEAAGQGDFTNMMFLCLKPSGLELSFREATAEDWLGSSARKEYMVPKHEILPEAFEREGEHLTKKNVKALERWQTKSALGHWHVMRGVLPPRVWELW